NALFTGLFQSLGNNGVLSLQSPSAQIRTKQFQSLAWDRFQAQSSFGNVRSVGGWNENSELYGKLQINGKKPKTWKLQGTRNQPQFTAEAL
ncbi:MAG: hypothetical protein ACXWC9_11285, partial [Pseudobdellovibrionaceae bacterium]